MSSFFNNNSTISLYPLDAAQIKAVQLKVKVKSHKSL